MKNLENGYLMGKYNYPRDVATTQKIMVNYKPMEKSNGAISDGIIFATNGRPRTKKNK